MDVEYLKQDVAAALEEGLATVVKYQPDDQVEFLGQYLLKYVSNQQQEAARAEARAARERAAKAASARRYAEAKQQEIADGESSKLAAEAEGVTSALGAGTDTEPADLVQKVVNAVQLFTGATGVYLGERDEPDNEGETLCVRYSHATEDHKDMLGKTLQVGEGVTFDVWKVPEKTEEEEEDAGDEDGEGKVEKPPAFSPVEVRNVLLNSTSKFFRRPAPGAYYAVPIRYKSSLYKGSITDAAVEAFNAQVATAKEAIAAAEAKKAEAEAAAAAAAAAAAEAAEAGEDGGEEGEEKGDAKADGDEAEAAPEEPLPEIPRMPAVAKRNVDLVLCLDTLGQGRPFTEAEKKAANEWAAWLGRSLEELEMKHVTEDWDVLYASQQKNAERLTVLEEKKGEYASTLEEKLAEIAEDLEDEARADEIARVRLWAAKSQLDDIRDMIYEIQRRRVPFKDPEIRILKAVVYCVGEQHSDLVDPYARRSNEVAWKYMRRAFDKDLYDRLVAFDPHAEPPNGKYGELEFLQGLVEGLDVETIRAKFVCIGALLRFVQAALQARAAALALRKAQAEAAAAAAAAMEADEAARKAAEEGGEGGEDAE